MFEGWGGCFPGLEVESPDLQAGLNVAEAGMSNYEAAAVRASDGLPRPLALGGWSMGGLVAMLAARRVEPDALVLLEPSPPAEVQGLHPELPLEPGTFDPEKAYGAFPAGHAARPESRLARAERKRGISVPSLDAWTRRVLVVYGDEYADERGRAVARRYHAEGLAFPGLSHWDLVLDARVPRAVAGWLAGQADSASSASAWRT